jgi:hypothetical protein
MRKLPAAGIAIKSDSSIRLNPVIEAPSKPTPVVERAAQLVAADRERLQLPEDVGEPEADELDVLFVDATEHVLRARLLVAIRVPSFARGGAAASDAAVFHVSIRASAFHRPDEEESSYLGDSRSSGCSQISATRGSVTRSRSSAAIRTERRCSPPAHTIRS